MSDSPRFDVPALGKTWAVVPPRRRDKDEFCRWLKAQARKEVVEAKADLPPEDYQQQLSQVMTCAAAGLYAWSGPLCQQALKQPGSPGRMHMLLLILLRNHPTLTAEDPEDNPAEAVYEAAALIEAIKDGVETLRNEFDVALDAVLDPSPNSRPPATPGAKG